MKITVGLVDDHQLFLKSLILMLQSFDSYEVILEAGNGKELQQKMAVSKNVPDMILLDVSMPVMDGLETATWLNQQHPAAKIVALTSKDEDATIIKMIKAGCCAYMLKDTHPNEFERALSEIHLKGYYNGDVTNIRFRRLLLEQQKSETALTEKEKIFLQLACSEKTYKQIAAEMKVSERTVDGYRESLFEKMQVQSRVGMALEAIRREWVKM